MILIAEDVGQDREVVAFFDEAHGHAGNRRLDGHTGIHQRQARAANGRHRARTIGLGNLRHHANDVAKFIHIGHHGLDTASRQLAVANFTALGRTDKAGLADAERREVVVQHERLFALALYRIDDLGVAPGAEGRYDDRLRLPACEQRRTVRTRQDSDTNVDGPYGALVATINSWLAPDNTLPNDRLFQLR